MSGREQVVSSSQLPGLLKVLGLKLDMEAVYQTYRQL